MCGVVAIGIADAESRVAHPRDYMNGLSGGTAQPLGPITEPTTDEGDE